MRGKVQVILNPISGRGLALRVLPELEAGLKKLGYEADIYQTQQAGDGRRVVEALDPLPDIVLAMGGDGTVNEVVNGLVGKDAALTIFPTGTSNVFCRETGLKGNVQTLLDVFANGEVLSVDLGQADERFFLSLAGCGPDAFAVRELTAMRTGPIHMINYTGPILRTLFRYSFDPIRIEVDGQLLTDDACGVVISNTAAYGGPMSFTPNASITDGLFDIVAFQRRSRWHMVKFAWGGLTRSAHRFRDVKFIQGREVRVTSDADDIPVQVDGDNAGRLPQTFRLIPGAMRVLLPKKG